MRALEIIYSSSNLLCNSIPSCKSCETLFGSGPGSSFTFVWQHVPDSSFSLVCILQHFVSFIDILHIPHVHNSYNCITRTYHRVPLKNSGNCNYSSYTLSFLLGNPFANHSTNLVHGQQIIFHSFLIILSLLNSIEVLISIFCFPFTTIFYIPFGSLYLPIKRNFILHRERWNAPD